MAPQEGVRGSRSHGQRHAIIGPNGAGKTTFLNLITGWQPPSGGEILVHGVPIRQGRPDLVTRSGLSRSFQKNMLLESVTSSRT